MTRDGGALSTLDDRFTRLRSWSLDEAHLIQSVRYQEPQYRNPSELRADVRELLARYDALVLHRARTEDIDERHAPDCVWPNGACSCGRGAGMDRPV